MRILFDTNVLVSAFLTGGSCYDIVDHSIHEHQLYYTTFIIDELEKVFKNNFHFPKTVIDEFALFVHKFFIKGKSADKIDNICKDTDDNQLLADAAINNIDIVITGDKELLDLKTYQGARIISPKEYWKL